MPPPEIYTLLLHSSLFFFNDTATPEIYTLSLHDALPIYFARAPSSARENPRRRRGCRCRHIRASGTIAAGRDGATDRGISTVCNRSGCANRSEEHTSELQSRQYLVCRLLLEKKQWPYKIA